MAPVGHYELQITIIQFSIERILLQISLRQVRMQANTYMYIFELKIIQFFNFFFAILKIFW